VDTKTSQRVGQNKTEARCTERRHAKTTSDAGGIHQLAPRIGIAQGPEELFLALIARAENGAELAHAEHIARQLDVVQTILAVAREARQKARPPSAQPFEQDRDLREEPVLRRSLDRQMRRARGAGERRMIDAPM